MVLVRHLPGAHERRGTPARGKMQVATEFRELVQMDVGYFRDGDGRKHPGLVITPMTLRLHFKPRVARWDYTRT